MSAGLDVAARGWRSGDGNTAGSRLTSGLLSARFWVIALLVLAVGVGILFYLAIGRTETGNLNPRSTKPEGAKALVEVLATQGQDVRTTESFSAARDAAEDGATVLIFDEESVLTAQGASGIATASGENEGSLLLLSPSFGTLTAMGLPISPAGATQIEDPTVDQSFLAGAEPAPPGCADPVAMRAGEISGGGRHYQLVPGTAGNVCYPAEGRPIEDSGAMVRIPAGDGYPSATVLGNWAMASNSYLDEYGNAALLTALSSTADELVYYEPDAGDQPGQPQANDRPDTTALVPPQFFALVLWTLPVLLAVVLWRGRRFGPLVVEPRPVLVRAAELQEGRAALYRSQDARDRALHHLRRRTRGTLARRLRVDDARLDASVALALGRSFDEIHFTLTTAQPGSDAEFADLARRLLALESEVPRA